MIRILSRILGGLCIYSAFILACYLCGLSLGYILNGEYLSADNLVDNSSEISEFNDTLSSESTDEAVVPYI